MRTCIGSRVVFSVLLATVQQVLPCPPACSCFYEEHLLDCSSYHNTFTTNCTSRHLESFPRGLEAESRHLDMSHNNITRLENNLFRKLNLTFLQRMYLNDNDIKRIHVNAFSGLQHLTLLALYNNRIESLHADTFKDCLRLVSLQLSGNPILLPRTGPFLNVLGLEFLDLSSCNLNYLSRPLLLVETKLQVLKINNNKLKTVDIERYRNLLKLEMGDNHIKNVTILGKNDKLKFLILNNNRRLVVKKCYPLMKSRSLNYLHINRCGLSEIHVNTFSSVVNLIEIKLDHNLLSNINNRPFDNLLSLRILSLRFNHITYIEPDTFSSNVNLQILDLSGNKILLPAEGQFLLSIPSLQELALASCDIGQLPTNVFDGVSSVKKISLARNKLQSVAKRVVERLTQLQDLDLADNPLDCDARLQGLWYWCQQRGVDTSATCLSPKGDWRMLEHLKFDGGVRRHERQNKSGQSAHNTTTTTFVEVLSRCGIPIGSVLAFTAVVLLVRRIVNSSRDACEWSLEEMESGTRIMASPTEWELEDAAPGRRLQGEPH